MSRPYGSTTNGHVGTHDGSPWNARNPRRTEAHPLPKPSYQSSAGEFNEVMNSMQDIIANVDERSNAEILASLKKAANMMSMRDKAEYWLSDEGQSELLRRIDMRAKKPDSGLSMFDYTSDTKAISSAATASDGDDWIEVELTADTGARDTVMPRAMAQGIPIQPSLQSLSS